MDAHEHWEKVYAGKAPAEVSWFRPHLETSLALIERASVHRSAWIIDVGGGASSLVDDLIVKGYRNITILDISHSAMELAKKRLGEVSESVHWLYADITHADLPAHSYDVWHDRAVFHFLITPEARLAYVRRAALAVKPGGHVIVGTFGPEGPNKCSGLDVMRYDAEALHEQFGRRFRLVESSKELHLTPFGTIQQFVYCYCTLDDSLHEGTTGVVLASVMTCPRCGVSKRETMPTDACQFFYECGGCHTLLQPKPGDCCVYCSYGSVKCPSVQAKRPSCH